MGIAVGSTSNINGAQVSAKGSRGQLGSIAGGRGRRKQAEKAGVLDLLR